MRGMKDSGVQWIGNIPTTWSISRMKYVGQYVNGFAFKPEQWGPEGKRIIRIQDLTGSNENPNYYAGELDDKYNVTAGDILISWAATLDAFVWKKEDGWLNQHIFKAIPKLHVVDYNFYFWLIKEAMKNMNNDNKHGIVMQHVTLGVFGNYQIPIPPLEEQVRIATFLDKECAEIDTLISRTRGSIAEYKKLKQTVITQAVTKGVRGERFTKRSGMDWVPKLPDTWATIPSKFLFRNSDLRRRPNDEQLTASQKYGIISQREYMERENAKIVLANKGIEDWKHVEPYDFVISLRSFQGGLEMSETTGCVTWHYIVLKPCKPIVSKYYKWLFKSEAYIKALQRTCNFIRDGQDLRYSNFVQVPLFEPPLAEQQEIADFLDRKCADIDRLIAQKEQFLTEIENYKKTLIYEYVTGKKEVPAEQAEVMAVIYPYFPAVLNTKKARFAQAVLAGRILDKCRVKMGRVKLEKMLYTIEASIGFDFDTEYVRQAAGPLDDSVYDCEGIISRKNKWYTIKQSGYGVSYKPAKDNSKYLKYYDKYFSGYDSEIERIINIFMNFDADQAEIIATLFAAWNDFVIDKKQFTDEDLVDEVRNNWHDSKKRFSAERWLAAIKHMREINLVPQGYGKRTVINHEG